MKIHFELTFHLVSSGESFSDFKTEASVHSLEEFHAVLDAINQEVLKIMQTLDSASRETSPSTT